MKSRHSIRLKGFDYSSNGAYFVTICTKNREEIFGSIGVVHEQPEMILNQYGKIVDQIIKLLTGRFPLDIDTYQIMPNHTHMILVIGDPYVGAHHDAPKNHMPTMRAIHESPLRRLSAQKRSLLSQIIGFLKMNSSKSIHQIIGAHHLPIWQRNYFEHIIRNEIELNKIREYITLNPQTWARDRNNPENLYV